MWSFSGVRPLHDGHARAPDATTRDYVLELDATPGSVTQGRIKLNFIADLGSVAALPRVARALSPRHTMRVFGQCVLRRFVTRLMTVLTSVPFGVRAGRIRPHEVPSLVPEPF
jgi:hypothetical protein